MLAVAGAGLWLPGTANQVSLARAYLAAPAMTYAVDSGRLGLLAVTVALAGLSDLVDGTIARRSGEATPLGGALDPVVDGLFFGAVAVGLAVGGAYPAWLAAIVVLRYALPAAVGGILLRLGRAPGLRHTPLGQVATTMIALLLGWAALWRGLGLDAGPLVAGAEVAIPMVTLGAFANLYWVNRQAFAPGVQG
jgi:cardiolipin synthase